MLNHKKIRMVWILLENVFVKVVLMDFAVISIYTLFITMNYFQ